MSVHAEKAPMTPGTTFEPATVNVRIKISALWTAMMFVFAYVDLFSLYRPDVRADLEAGQIERVHHQPGVPAVHHRVCRHPRA